MSVWEVERDRFGLLFSGPYLKVGEWVQVVPLRKYETLRDALRDLYEDVQCAEAVGICLPDRVSCLRAGDVLESSRAGRTEEDE